VGLVSRVISLTTHRYDPALIYVAGGYQHMLNNSMNATAPSARIFRGNATDLTWTPMTLGAHVFNQTAPPGGCRHLAFNNRTQELLYAHNTGLALRTLPRSSGADGRWEDATTNLHIAEINAAAVNAGGTRMANFLNQGTVLKRAGAAAAHVMDSAAAGSVAVASDGKFWYNSGSMWSPTGKFGYLVPETGESWYLQFDPAEKEIGAAIAANAPLTPALPFVTTNSVAPQRVMFCVGGTVIGCYEPRTEPLTGFSLTKIPGDIFKIWGGDYYDVYVCLRLQHLPSSGGRFTTSSIPGNISVRIMISACLCLDHHLSLLFVAPAQVHVRRHAPGRHRHFDCARRLADQGIWADGGNNSTKTEICFCHYSFFNMHNKLFASRISAILFTIFYRKSGKKHS
jgi:hypothetical protein